MHDFEMFLVPRAGKMIM